jgi:hypothetical protein
MDLEKLTTQQKRDFAVDCFDRVYKHMSHYDHTGEFRKAVDAARTQGDNPEARKFCRTFVRTLCKGSAPANIVAAAKAGRECLQDNPAVVASLAAEASANPKESEWQASHLQEMLRES